MFIPCEWISNCVIDYRYWKSIRANDVTCGVDEHTMNGIDATFGINDCQFAVIERQKVYVV
jgi:hypothetical protein